MLKVDLGGLVVTLTNRGNCLTRWFVICLGLWVGIPHDQVVRSEDNVMTVDDLVRMTGPQLDALYAAGTVPPIPNGRVTGRAIYYPGTKLTVPMSVGARLVWQGKIFDSAAASAKNRFFGVRSVPGQLYEGESWKDGGAALILDYEKTSRIYANYRDEIRQIGPGLYLGLMYDRRTSPVTLKMYFALQEQN
jgi:hypothetical protein